MDIIVVDTCGISFSQAEKYLSCVSAARRSVVMKKSGDESRVQSLAAALLVRTQLSNRLGIAQNKLVFEKGAHGKPFVKGFDIQFSLSHTKGAVCAAFSENGEIGVDIEHKKRRISDRLKQRVFSENECAAAGLDEDFIRMWVKKEAFLKRTGIGIATQLCGADTTIIPELVAFECGEYYIGAAGKDCGNASVKAISFSELVADL